VTGAGEKWKKHIILSILGIRNSFFALKLANKGLGNQARAEVFTGLAQAVQSDLSHGIREKPG